MREVEHDLELPKEVNTVLLQCYLRDFRGAQRIIGDVIHRMTHSLKQSIRANVIHLNIICCQHECFCNTQYFVCPSDSQM